MKNTDQVEIIYDGDCPICKHFTLKRSIEQQGIMLILTNARNLSIEQLHNFKVRGYDINKGMLLIHQQNHYYGHDAMTKLIKMSKSRCTIERYLEKGYLKINSPNLYQVLVRLRLFLLKIIGKNEM
ncbi:hypothetical protein SOPP22_17900 [Shewanella sp. OPT22]|nr:hypothetical protein SOPP22_17900 [Shewanella sp. OPT22]